MESPSTPSSGDTTGFREAVGGQATLNGPVHLIVGTANTPGGIPRYCQELYKGLREHMEVRLCSFRPPPLAGQLTFLEHLPLGVKPDAGRGIYHFTRIMGCALMLWRPAHPAVATVHDLGPLVWPPESDAMNTLDRLLFRLSLLGLKKMDRIVAVSQATAQSVVKLLGVPAARVLAIHEAVDTGLFQRMPAPKEALRERFDLNLDDGTLNVLYVGSEAPRKNLGTLLEALALLKLRGVAARLVKVGPSGHARYRAACAEQVARLDLEGAVLFVDQVPDKDLPLFYSAADVLALPSNVEGFGLPVLEAMACGTPVVCSNAGALPEVVGDAALLVNPQDMQGWAGAIATVLTDHNLKQELAAKGLERCRQFSWDETVRQTMAVYSELR